MAELTDEDLEIIERTAEAHRTLWKLADGNFVEVLSRNDMFLAGKAAGIAAERERCARVCEARAIAHFEDGHLADARCEAENCAAAIRAGEKEER